MRRLAPPDPATYSERQKEVAAAVSAGPRGEVVAPIAMWLHRPELAEAGQRLGQYCRYDSSLPLRLSELAICTVAGIWRAEFEWYAHAPIAREAGIDPGILEAIRKGETPVFADEAEAAVHDFVLHVQRDRRAPQPVYDRALAALGKDGLVDLVGLLGYYSLISITLNVFEVPIPEGATKAFA